MNIKEIFGKILSAGIISGFVYLFYERWHNWFFALPALLLYFLSVSSRIQRVLIRYFNFEKALRTKLLALFLNIVTLGWFLGIFVFFNYFNSLAVFIAFFLNSIAWSLAAKDISEEAEETDEPVEISDEPPHTIIGILIYLILLSYGFFLLAKSQSGAALNSPWQTIEPKFVVIFLLATFLLGLFICFSKMSVKALLLLIILHSFLLHSYLPLTQKLVYGADGWRHMTNEQRLVEGKIFKEAELADSGNPKSKVQSLKSKVGELSYGNFWGTNAVFSKMIEVDLLVLNKWMLPIVWSIIFTIMLYEFGFLLGWGSRNALLFSWAGMLPFALQVGGSFSLPVNWGLLSFILFFLLILKRARAPGLGQKNILIALGVGSIFGYLLYFVLFWLSWGIVKVIKFVRLKTLILFFVASLFIPAIELFGGYSQIDKGVNILLQAKQFIGNTFAIYLASGPRPHNIDGGNILFNQTPSYAFVANFLTQFRWWLPAFVLTAILLVFWSIIKNSLNVINARKITR